MSKSLNIYLISGPLGVGKSSLSKMISNKLGYELIVGDDFLDVTENDESLSWEERLRISWGKIIDKTHEAILFGKNIVIDFVVEDELKWFLEKVRDQDVQVKYMVLIADEEEIIRRLKKRDGSTQFLDRSKVLLKQLKSNEKNSSYIIDTTGKTTEDVYQKVLEENDRFCI